MVVKGNDSQGKGWSGENGGQEKGWLREKGCQGKGVLSAISGNRSISCQEKMFFKLFRKIYTFSWENGAIDCQGTCNYLGVYTLPHIITGNITNACSREKKPIHCEEKRGHCYKISHLV